MAGGLVVAGTAVVGAVLGRGVLGETGGVAEGRPAEPVGVPATDPVEPAGGALVVGSRSEVVGTADPNEAGSDGMVAAVAVVVEWDTPVEALLAFDRAGVVEQPAPARNVTMAIPTRIAAFACGPRAT